MKPTSPDRLRRLQQSWDRLGEMDPMWAILTDAPEKLGNGWDEAEFFATGVEDIQALFAGFSEHGIEVEGGSALDFGCGVGRLTQALAGHFTNITGVDIAPSMIARAKELNKHGERCQYLVNAESDLRLFPDNTFDLVYSTQVLQHMAPEFARSYITEFIRIIKPGGVCVFQLPEPVPQKLVPLALHLVMPLLLKLAPTPLVRYYRKRKYKNASEEVIKAMPKSVMEMHGMLPKDVRELAERAGGTVVAIEENKRVGEVFRSWQYYIKKTS